MKRFTSRLLSVVLIVAFALSCFACYPMTVSAAPIAAASVAGYVNSLVDYHTINGVSNPNWPDGQGLILTHINDAPVGTLVGIRGWAGFNRDISAAGYYFDSDSSNISWSGSVLSLNTATPEDAGVVSYAGALAKRYEIVANTAGLSSGNHTVHFVLKLSDGSMAIVNSLPLNDMTGGSTSGSTSGSAGSSTNDSTTANNSSTSSIPDVANTGADYSNDFYTTNTTNEFSYRDNVEAWKTTIVGITPNDTAGLKGWVGFGSKTISSFGYYWDNNTSNITYSAGFAQSTGNDVLNAGGANARRFHIIASCNTAPSSGHHTLHFVAKFSDGTVIRLGYWILNIVGTPTEGGNSGSGNSGSGNSGSGDGSGSSSDSSVSDYKMKYPVLSHDMQPVLADGNGYIWEETVMFIDGISTTKTLLHPISEVLEVKFVNPSTGAVTYYKEGTHFTVTNGKIKMISGSGIKCMPSTTWSNWQASPGGSLGNLANNTYWGEGDAMTKWQVRITYKTNSTWSGVEQTTYRDSKYANLISKLERGDDVTFIFYGDSITYGANAGFSIGIKPADGYSYTMLFTMAVADLYNYKVRFVASPNGTPLPSTYTPAKGGTAGTITYINSAVGGWTSADANTHYGTHIKNYAAQYGCDLFSYAFGMNDGGMTPAQTANYANAIIADVKANHPNASVAVISTMIPNPKSAVSGLNTAGQKSELAKIVKNHANTALVDMTSVSQAVYNKKGLFADYSGNNVNHPNDFLHRIYAQTLFDAVIGYENVPTEGSSGSGSVTDPEGGSDSGSGNKPHVCNFGAWINTKTPTCTETGTRAHQCSCGKSETETVPMLDHIEGDWIVDTPAQPGVSGSQHTECTVCGNTVNTADIPALPALPDEDSTTASEDATDTPENVTDAPENVTDAPEDVTDTPQDVTDAPEDTANTSESEDTVSAEDSQEADGKLPSLGCASAVGTISMMLTLTAAGILLKKKKED